MCVNQFGNYQFDLEVEWSNRLSFSDLELNSYGDGSFRGENNISGPRSLYVNEELKKLVDYRYVSLGEGIPVDLFVWSYGEPEARYVTKISGLPFRSKNLCWPRTDKGVPITFLGQINFSDSIDIVGSLPGDILLIFGDYHDEIGTYQFYLEWQKFGISNLVDCVPELPELIQPCFGAIIRRIAYPTVRVQFETGNGFINAVEPAKFINDWQELFLYPATQIGNCPPFIQPEDELRHDSRLICRLNSLNPRYEIRYQWANVEHFHETNLPETECLMIGDLGAIDVWIDENGFTHAAESSY